MNAHSLPRPDRLRTMDRPFGWAPCRLVSSGLLPRLSLAAKALYLGLCLVADRRGLSYWSDRRLEALLGLDTAELQHAREELVHYDLLAFDGRLYQLLSLPAATSRSRASPASPSSAKPAEPKQVAAILATLMAKLEKD